MFSQDDYSTAEEYLRMYCPKPDGEITGTLPPDWEEQEDKRDMDIIIPCYNVEKYVEECLNSVVHYRFKKNVGIILVDDGSTDRTGKILDSYEELPRVKVIHQDNRGLAEARNVGMRHSYSRFLFFIDSDDYVRPQYVEEMLEFAMENDADCVRGGVFQVMDGRERKLEPEEDSGEMEEILPVNSADYAWGTVIRAGMFKEICYPKGYIFEDVLMHLVFSPLCKKSYFFHRGVYGYRLNPEGITAKSQDDPKAVHSFWILYPVFDAIRRLNIQIDSALYGKILTHIAQTHIRIWKQNDNVKVAVFIATCGIMKEINKSAGTEDQYRSLLQKAMLMEDYGIYDQTCRLIFDALRVGR